MNSNSFYILSPSEITEAVKKHNETSRINRLLAVRNLNKQIAKKQRQTYHKSLEKTLSLVCKDLKTDWSNQKQTEINILQEQINKNNLIFGLAQSNASEINNIEIPRIYNATLLKETKKQILLSTHTKTAAKTIKETNKKISDHRENLSTLKNKIKSTESNRTKSLLKKFNHSQKTTISYLPPPPTQPLTNLNLKISRKLAKFGSGSGSGVPSEYDISSHHRAVAVKSVHFGNRRINAIDGAGVARYEMGVREVGKKARGEFNEVERVVRGEGAMRNVLIEKGRNRLLKDLKGLKIDDLKRKQGNTVGSLKDYLHNQNPNSVSEVFKSRFMEPDFEINQRKKLNLADKTKQTIKNRTKDTSVESIRIVKF